jgi:aryl sulfotransferase
MVRSAVSRPIEAEYRSVLSDNRRWARFTPRPDDVLVCTPAKCGTTWMQTIVTTLLFPNGAPAPVMELAPWLDARFRPVDELVDRLERQAHRRQVKTHTPADGIPWYPECAYILVYRDGRDAFMSLYNHMRNMRPHVIAELALSAPDDGIPVEAGTAPPLDDVHAFFDWWIESDSPLEHLASFWPHRDETNVLFAHYDDMKADLAGQMQRVADFLEIDFDPAARPDLVERCTFAGMKRRADEIGEFDSRWVGGADTFLYKGTNGRWRDVLTPDELDRFEQRQREVLPPQALRWLTATPEVRAAQRLGANVITKPPRNDTTTP